MYVHEAIADVLHSAGVDTLFGLIGDANLFLVKAFVDRHGGSYVSATHETGAVMMAEGYALRRGGLGVATVTQGPGLTNAATALIEAVKTRTALVVITGSTQPSNAHTQQDMDQATLVAATGAEYLLVTDPADAAATVSRAVAVATREGRPVVVVVPTEFQWAEVAAAEVWTGTIEPTPTPQPSGDVLDEAMGIIVAARRPLVLAGYGAVDPDARRRVLDFAERLGAPIATTLRARHLYGPADGSVGVFGTVANEIGGETIAAADTIITFGAALNPWTTSRQHLTRGKAIIQVDSDAAHLNRHLPATVAVHGDAAEVATTFTEYLDAAEAPAAGFRRQVSSALTADSLRFHAPLGSKVTLAGVLSAITDAIPAERTVVFDAGRFLGEGFKYVDAGSHTRQILTTSFGSIGLGMGAAIGAACAAPDQPTVLVTGDGGFMMNGLGELHSAVRASSPLVVIICNDGAYGAEYIQFADRGLDEKLSLFPWPSFAEVARSLGADAYTIDTVDDVAQVLPAVAAPTGPVVIDLRVDPANVPFSH